MTRDPTLSSAPSPVSFAQTLMKWLSFYASKPHKYPHLGVLAGGHFFSDDGQPTAAYTNALDVLKRSEAAQAAFAARPEMKEPSCDYT